MSPAAYYGGLFYVLLAKFKKIISGFGIKNKEKNKNKRERREITSILSKTFCLLLPWLTLLAYLFQSNK
jgi:hypothetical protein